MCVWTNQLQPVIREDADAAPVTPHSSVCVNGGGVTGRRTPITVCTGEGQGEGGREEPLAANVHKQHRAAAAAAAAATRSQEQSRSSQQSKVAKKKKKKE